MKELKNYITESNTSIMRRNCDVKFTTSFNIKDNIEKFKKAYANMYDLFGDESENIGIYNYGKKTFKSNSIMCNNLEIIPTNVNVNVMLWLEKMNKIDSYISYYFTIINHDTTETRIIKMNIDAAINPNRNDINISINTIQLLDEDEFDLFEGDSEDWEITTPQSGFDISDEMMQEIGDAAIYLEYNDFPMEIMKEIMKQIFDKINFTEFKKNIFSYESDI